MPPIRRVVFVDEQGQPIRPRPSRLTPLEDEVQGDQVQDELVEFGESRAPPPAAASVHHTILPAPVGAAKRLSELRKSNELRERPRRRRRRAAKRRPARAKARPRQRPVRRRTTTRTTRKSTVSRGGRTRTRRTTTRRTTTASRRVR